MFLIAPRSICCIFCSFLVFLSICNDVTFALPQWGVVAAADYANSIDRSERSSKDSASSQNAPTPFPYNPYGYFPFPGPPRQIYHNEIGGRGYAGLPWWGFSGYWRD